MKTTTDSLKVAIVAEELTQLGGSERVLDCLIELFPQAPIYTVVWDDQKTLGKYRGKDIRTSFIQKLPLGVKKYKWYLPLMPRAIERWRFDQYDLVLSVTSALVKGIKTKKPTIHICYCNTPTRYLWFDSRDYLKNAPIPKFVRPIMPWVLKSLRRWDLKACQRPDFYLANSENVRGRIKKYYQRDSISIFPPVEVNKFALSHERGKYYLIVSRLEPYKKVDLVIDTFKRLKLPLVIVGSGTRLEQYRRMTASNIKFVGRVDDKKLPLFYQNSIATIFPQDEDAGIVPLESMASGRPVIAFKKGGALESVIESKTGIFFEKQTVASLSAAIRKFQKITFDPKEIRAHAKKFDKDIFKQKIINFIESKN